jgi:hypothetical protein
VDPDEAARLVGATLAALEVPCTVSATERQVVVRVLAHDILVDLGQGMASLRPGLPAYVGRFPIRYQTETGSLGPHGPRGSAPDPG